MTKIYIEILFVFFLIFVSFIQAKGAVIDSANLDSRNILTDNQIEITVDNKKSDFTSVLQNNILYVESRFFFANFPAYKDLVKEIDIYGGILVKDMSEKKVECVPVYFTLNALKVAYTYDAVYGKAIIIIRTDREPETEQTAASQPPETTTGGVTINYGGSSSGNLPQGGNNNSNAYPGYSGTNPTGAIPLYNDTTVPVDYGYYYPPGYNPGYSFGSYGTVNEAPAPANVYNSVKY